MTIRGDNRLDDVPMAPVICRACHACVLVRKSSWNQTSVQWNTEASARCLERRTATATGYSARGVFLACAALNASIIDGVDRVPVVDDMAEPVENGAT